MGISLKRHIWLTICCITVTVKHVFDVEHPLLQAVDPPSDRLRHRTQCLEHLELLVLKFLLRHLADCTGCYLAFNDFGLFAFLPAGCMSFSDGWTVVPFLGYKSQRQAMLQIGRLQVPVNTLQDPLLLSKFVGMS